MILYEESKALEQVIGVDAAKIITKIFERQGALVTMELPTKKDLADGLQSLRADFQTALRESELRIQLEIEKVRAEVKGTEGRLQTELEKIRAEVKGTEGRLQTELEKIRAEVKETEGRLQTEFEKIRAETRETEAKLKMETEKVRGELKMSIEKIRYNLLIWQFGIALALAAIMAKGFGWIGF